MYCYVRFCTIVLLHEMTGDRVGWLGPISPGVRRSATTGRPAASKTGERGYIYICVYISLYFGLACDFILESNTDGWDRVASAPKMRALR